MKIFFSGIGGSGVSAIAGFLAEKGHTIHGSDRLFDAVPGHPLKGTLEAGGILIRPQDGSGIDRSFDLVVFSTAVERSNPDFIAAERFGISTKTRPEYLAEIVAAFKTIAIAGTSGKSTTAGMLAYLMQKLGFAPNLIGGGKVKQFKTKKNLGNYAADNSDILVIEACESDGSIVNYRPAHSILLNLDLDHHAIEDTAEMFETLSDHTSGDTLLNADDENLMRCRIRGAATFSLDERSEYQAVNAHYHSFSTDFEVYGQDFSLSLPGRHNLYNALACIAFLGEMEVPLEEIAAVLPGFSGIERRFDVHLNDGRRLVIDDYAHNPHKIRSLMQTMQPIADRVCYIFQPHGFGPTRLMKDGYITSFREGLRDGDRLVLLPIFYAGGTAAKDISSRDISGPLKNSEKDALAVDDRGEIFGVLDGYDACVVFGARDDSLSALAESIAQRMK